MEINVIRGYSIIDQNNSAKTLRKTAGSPTQTRSHASLKRMLSAARSFMLERGSEEFTLQEVSQKGKVSIGSIYHRFAGKEDLVRAVISAELERIGSAEMHMIERVLGKSTCLADYVLNYVSGYAEILRENSLIIRLAMQRATFDAQVSGYGRSRELAAATEATATLHAFRSEIAGEVDTKARIVFQTVFATVARHLSLDTQDPIAMKEDWKLLLTELSWMMLSYLTADRTALRVKTRATAELSAIRSKKASRR